MPALKKVKQEAFCVAFTKIGADTFGHGIKSAIDAGYEEKSARTQAWRLLKNEEISRRIVELYDENLRENRVTAESVLANLAHDRLMARKAGQYSVAVRCSELEGKYLALFTDRLAVDPEKKAKREAISKKQEELCRAYQIWYVDQLAMGKDPKEEIEKLKTPFKPTLYKPDEQPPIDEPKESQVG